MRIPAIAFLLLVIFTGTARAQDFFKDRPVLALAAIQTAANLTDAAITENHWKSAQPVAGSITGTFTEYNPIARPFVGHPAAFYTSVVLYDATSAYVAHRMRTSNNRFLRRMWWLPQTIGIASGIFGATSSTINWRSN